MSPPRYRELTAAGSFLSSLLKGVGVVADGFCKYDGIVKGALGNGRKSKHKKML